MAVITDLTQPESVEQNLDPNQIGSQVRLGGCTQHLPVCQPDNDSEKFICFHPNQTEHDDCVCICSWMDRMNFENPENEVYFYSTSNLRAK